MGVDALPGMAPVVSVVLCTFNRAHLLGGALEALLRQDTGTPPYEVVVVDNNSTDDTREVVGRLSGGGRLRYEFEPRQGLSAARNRGIAVARGDILAFTDDDVRVESSWVRSVAQAFRDHPEVDVVGGKVEPQWGAPPPPWLRAAGHAPLAIVDYGDRAFRITGEGAVCLVGANLAVRRRAIERAGGFSTHLQRVRDGVGSTEDHELQLRLLRGGSAALYDPRLVVQAPVPRERLSKRYHRRWHQGHGRFYAIMREPSFERTRRGRPLGVPAHVYRSACCECLAWAATLLTGRPATAFAHELRLRFLMAFAIQRIFGRT